MIDRGKLKKPSLFLFYMVKICVKFFEVLIHPLIGKEVRNPSSTQLKGIFYKLIIKLNLIFDLESQGVCSGRSDSISDMINEAVKILTNIILNNLRKNETDNFNSKKNNIGHKHIKKNQKLTNISQAN